MKLCVASDYHGNFDALCRMLEKENPHCLLFLGDGVRDAEDAGMLFGCQVLAVAGNCDLMCQEPLTRTPQPEGVRLFLSHGHRFGVKDGLDEFLRAAQQAGAQAAFFGHTHQPVALTKWPVPLYNPGSIGYEGTYLRLEIDQGQFSCSLERIDRDV